MMDDRRSLTLGIVLLLVGAFFLFERTASFSGPAGILLLLGAIFLAISAARRFSGPLLPAGVLLGLGTGFLLQDGLARWMPRWSVLLLGLGAGFLLVAGIDSAVDRQRRPRPILPGVVLVAIALFAFLARQTRFPEVVENVVGLWPWALVAAGVVLVAQALVKRKA
jgi:hypothetical protein